MKKHVAELLSTPEIRNYILNFKRNFHESSWGYKLDKLAEKSSKDIKYIINATEWLFEDQEGNCWGILDEYAIYFTTDMTHHYACNHFEGIYEYYQNKRPDIIQSTRSKSMADGVNYDEIVTEYYTLLTENNIVPIFILEEEKFNQFVKKNK